MEVEKENLEKIRQTSIEVQKVRGELHDLIEQKEKFLDKREQEERVRLIGFLKEQERIVGIISDMASEATEAKENVLKMFNELEDTVEKLLDRQIELDKKESNQTIWFAEKMNELKEWEKKLEIDREALRILKAENIKKEQSLAQKAKFIKSQLSIINSNGSSKTR